MIDRKITFIQTWVCGSPFFKVSLSLQGKKLVVFVANDKIQAFNFGKLVSATVEFDNWPILEHFSDETGSGSNECDYLMSYNELCHLLKGLLNNETIASKCLMHNVM